MNEADESSFSTNTRNKFVTKVYSIVSIQLLITTAFVSLAVFNKSFAMFQLQNTWFLILSVVICFLSLIALGNLLLTQFTLNLPAKDTQQT